MAENIVVKSFSTALGIPADEAYQRVYENGGQGISWLKVNELKDIIRHLKNQGYYKVHLSISANKPALVMMLQACAAAEKDGAQDVAQPTAANAATMPTAGVTAAPPVNQHPSVRPAVPASAPAATARHAPTPGPPTFFSPPKAAQPSQAIQPNPQAKPSSHKKATPNKPANNHPGHLYSPKPGDDPDHRARLFRVLQGPRLTAFNMLKQVPGVTEREILDELEIQPVNEALDIDDILFDIVTKRESGQTGHNLVNAGEEELDALQEQENRDVDRAIRESEQERDVIQQRKRHRVEELRTGRDGYLTTEEYQRSVLLFGCCNTVGDADIALNGRNTDEGPMKVQKTGLASGGSVSGASKCSSGATATSGNSGDTAGLTKQAVQFNNNNALHSATSTFTSTLHSNNATSAASNTAQSRALSHKSNSTSSYTYSSTSNHNNYSSHTNTSDNANSSRNGNNSSSSVVDLTMDSESEDERIVYNRNINHSHSSGSDHKDNTGSQTASNGSSNGSSSGPFSHPNTNIISNSTNATSININTSNTASTANTVNTANATNTTDNAIVSKPNMSRSRIVHKLAHLLDQLHDMETINSAIDSANNTSSSIGNDSSSGNNNRNSSSSSSSNSSGMLTQPVNLHRRIYDVTYVHNCTSQCTTLLNSLRPVLSKLLLVEAEAMKFYENTSVAYLVHTARRIDGKLLCRTLDEAVNQTVVKSDPSATATIAPASTTYYPNDCIYYLPLIERYIKHTSIVALLTHEADKLQKGMHKLQTDGQLVPYIFRKPRIAYYARALATSIDTDGLEVLDMVNRNNITNNAATGGTNSSTKAANADSDRESNNNETESIEVDRCMDSSSEESVASPYNSDDDDF